MRRQFVNIVRINEFMLNKERATMRKIQHLAEKAAKRGRYQTARKTFIKTANPFVSLMIMRVTLKLWKKYNKQHKQRVEEYASKGIYNYESSVEEEDEYVPNELQLPVPDKGNEEVSKHPMITPTQLAIEEFSNFGPRPKANNVVRADSALKASLKGTMRKSIPKYQHYQSCTLYPYYSLLVALAIHYMCV
eukprot:TRINITY_DN1098_c0_g1_i2.p6 TRINITY_DN1098_c0_g1~~TRINITY_DN1098_c0_g1_i2.p6  ORF type:complete len:191 (+),score=16.60 TRINITY_DN1098_c0_g1_i2:1620-2192(+)